MMFQCFTVTAEGGRTVGNLLIPHRAYPFNQNLDYGALRARLEDVHPSDRLPPLLLTFALDMEMPDTGPIVAAYRPH